MYRHTSPANFDKSGFREPQFNGVRHLSPESNVPLTQTQIDAAVADAVGVSAPQAEIEPVARDTEIVTAVMEETATELAAELESPAVEPEVSASENFEPKPDQSQDAPEPVTEPEPSSDLQERATAYAQRLAGDLWEGVRNYKLPDDEGLRARRLELFGELLAVVEHAGALFADAHAIKMADFAEQHEAVRVECRATLDRINDLQMQIGPLDGQLRSRQQKSSKARALFSTLTESKPKAEQYPSAREIRQWEERLAKARAAVDTALADESAVNSVRNEIVRAIRQERELFNGKDGKPGLKQKELDLRAAKDGKPRRDYETGLTVPAEF